MSKKTTIALVLTTVFITGILIFIVLKYGTPGESFGSELTTIIDGDKTKGTPTADIQIMEYSDLQCPACSFVHFNLIKPFIEKNSDKVHYAFRHFPLSMHKNAFQASVAFEAALLQGKHWEMKDKLYAGQEEWEFQDSPDVVFEKYALEIGLDLQRYKKDYSSPETKQKVLQDSDKAIAGGLNSTPTIFVNGEKLKVMSDYSDFENSILNR